MPYPNEHAARIKEPSQFIDGSFRRKVIARGISIIVGKLKEGSGEMVTQAYRFDKDIYTASEALNWLKDHEVEYMKFEPAIDNTESNNDDYSESNNDIANQEIRFINTDICYSRMIINEAEPEQRFVSGIGIVYNSESEIFPGVFESIAPGAFRKSIGKFETIKSFINHDASKILSTTRSKPPLELLDSDENLQFISPIPPTSYGQDLIVNLERENIKGASFAFTVHSNGDTYKKDSEGNLHRQITSAEIYEVGPVTNPAYKQTEVGLRSKEFFDKKLEQISNEVRNDKELQIIEEFLLKRRGL